MSETLKNNGTIRHISTSEIEDTVCRLFIEANYSLPGSVSECLRCAASRETTPLASSVLSDLCRNIDAAAQLDVPVCQDTGMAVVFAQLGRDAHIDGSLEDAVNAGVARAYTEGYMRCSVVGDPLYNRKNTENNTPAVIYLSLTEGDRLVLTALPKGFGSENMSALRMFTPSATEDDIVSFVTETVRGAGANPCPPVVVGVGIGGTFDFAAVLSKRALARELDDRNPKPEYAALEEKMLGRINALGIGPQGFGGDTTALAVKIETYPTHIAGLPVAVNICCHVARHCRAEI